MLKLNITSVRTVAVPLKGIGPKKYDIRIVHFTVVCLVTLPLSGSETGGDLALIQTFLPFICY